MASSEELEQYINNEFGSYYLIDEIPNWSEEGVEQQLAKMAAGSARRFLYRIDNSQIENLVSILTDLRNKRNPSLLTRISEGSLMDWDATEEDWRMFQDIVDGIIANLKLGSDGK